MWCPSVSLSIWANSWLAGAAAPDDVLDALSCWAPAQSVAAYDAVSAGNTGLPWPGRQPSGPVSLLQLLRAATAGHSPDSRGCIQPVFPVPGDVRGLPPGTEFAREALAGGEAVIIARPGGRGAVGLIPEIVDDPDDDPVSALTWTVHTLPGAPAVEQHDLGDAEYALRSAVRSAAAALGAAEQCFTGPDIADPRRLVEQLVESMLCHRIPAHAPPRAVRVLETAAHVDAIIAVSSGLVPTAQSSSALRHAAEAVRPLTAVVRSARAAAVQAILHSAWGG